MTELREEIGTEACLVVKIGKCRIKWIGHMVRMKDKRLSKRSDKETMRLQKTRNITAR